MLKTPRKRKPLGHRLRVHIQDTFLDLYAAFVIYCTVLVTLETVLLCLLSVGTVSFCVKWYDYRGEPLSANINWCV